MQSENNKEQSAQPDFFIRQSRQQEIDMMIQLKELQGFRPGIYDFTAFKQLDNYEFWTAFLGDQPIGFFGSVIYDSGLVYLGSYFVLNQFRGKGHGIKIWNHVMERLKGKGNNWGLNGTLQQESNYKKWGFKTQSNGKRFLFKGINIKHESEFLIDCNQVDFNFLCKYDKENFPGGRQKFLAALVKLPRSKSVAFIRNNKIEGYGVVRITPNAYKIGPLVADSYEVAVEILKSLRSHVPQQVQVTIQTAQPHEDVLKLAAEFKMEQIVVNARMFTNGEPQFFKKKTVYSITSPEFG